VNVSRERKASYRTLSYATFDVIDIYRLCEPIMPQAGSPEGVIAIRMPKWGLSMDEGQVVEWVKRVGERFAEGEHLAEIETSKINNAFEAPAAGLLRRIVAPQGAKVVVGGLLAVAAEPSVSDEEIDRFVNEFQASFVSNSEEESAGPALKEHVVEVDGRRINVVSSEGAGIPVVLVHGFSSDLHSWDLTIGGFLRERPVIAIDLPGHGKSSKQVGSGSIKELAGIVLQTLRHLGIDPFHVVGHSLGGAVALEIGHLAPESVRSLSLLAPAGLPGSQLNREFLDRIVDGDRARDLRPALELLFANRGLASNELVDAMVQYKRIDGVQEGLAAIRDQLVGYAPPKLDTLPPTLSLWGAADQIVSQPSSKALPSTWRVVTFSSSGHLPQMEEAGKCTEVLIQFFREHS
jgi:pyruvate dehydrogenase E2 component (dihydrolipoamide acetyltransferase)